jgi:hypothetical protein
MAEASQVRGCRVYYQRADNHVNVLILRRNAMARTHGTPVVGEGKRGTEGHIAYLLRQAHGAVRSALDSALAASDLTTPQFLVLMWRS